MTKTSSKKTKRYRTGPPLDTETVEIYVARRSRCSCNSTEHMKTKKKYFSGRRKAGTPARRASFKRTSTWTLEKQVRVSEKDGHSRKFNAIYDNHAMPIKALLSIPTVWLGAARWRYRTASNVPFLRRKRRTKNSNREMLSRQRTPTNPNRGVR